MSFMACFHYAITIINIFERIERFESANILLKTYCYIVDIEHNFSYLLFSSEPFRYDEALRYVCSLQRSQAKEHCNPDFLHPQHFLQL